MTAATPLLGVLRELIESEGPIGVDRYMALALGHPVHGYYMTRDPFGATGDFTTAPEISQMFGELIGLWCAVVWQAIGGLPGVRLVELGPGRGTLMADVLRAATAVPAFRAALDLHLVETSPILRDLQAVRLRDASSAVSWHTRFETVPDGPAIILANEFFDALPVRHYVKTERGWCERLVGLAADGGLAFGVSAEAEAKLAVAAPAGAILELGPEAAALAGRIAARLVRSGGAALVIDYGHTGREHAETLQAVRHHAFVDVLEVPGEADLTAHVDFEALRRAGQAAGATVHGPVGQGAFLQSLGIAERAASLAARNPDQAGALEGALARLATAGDALTPGMGALFKVMALTAPGLPTPPGFADPVAPETDHR